MRTLAADFCTKLSVFGAKSVHSIQISAQSIPRTAHGTQGIAAAVFAERFAQAADVDINGAGVDIDVAPPDPTGLFHQGRQQAEFGGPQFEILPVAGDAVGFGVEDDILVFQTFAHGAGTGAAQLGADAGHEFDHGIGLYHVVVGPVFQAAHAVDLFGAGRQHDDRYAAGLNPGLKLTADLDARDIGQHPVEYDQVGRAFLDEHQGFFAVFRAGNAEPFGFEVIGQHFALGRFILDKQDGGVIGGHAWAS